MVAALPAVCLPATETFAQQNAAKREFVKSKEEEGGQANKFRWMVCRGTAQNGRPAAIAIFSHPENPRYPALWQTRTQYPYLNPSFTCNDDFTLKSGESLALRYGVLIHDGPCKLEKIESAWKRFAR